MLRLAPALATLLLLCAACSGTGAPAAPAAAADAAPSQTPDDTPAPTATPVPATPTPVPTPAGPTIGELWGAYAQVVSTQSASLAAAATAVGPGCASHQPAPCKQAMANLLSAARSYQSALRALTVPTCLAASFQLLDQGLSAYQAAASSAISAIDRGDNAGLNSAISALNQATDLIQAGQKAFTSASCT